MYPEHRLTHNWLIKRLLNKKVSECLLPHVFGTVLDLGCGVRPFQYDILAHADTYFGVDWHNTIHALMADVVADLSRPLPFRDTSVDYVVSFEVIEHLPEPDLILREALRVLRPGGRIAISMPFQWWVHEAPRDFQRFTRHGLEYQLAKAGFTGINIEPTSGFWSMWILKFNYQTNRLVRGAPWQRLPARLLLTPIWWLNQTIAPVIDRIWPEDRETAGYFATARKP